METVVLKLDPVSPEAEAIRHAADVIRDGGLVAFPTETVYGLGANALSAEAVAHIFVAKGRPATNPLIVHIADVSEVLNVASGWPETAAKLAARFWPGPLTLVVPKRDCVSDIVTANGPTVALRCPNHPVAHALIHAACVPLAAPSANRSTELSPTRAEHVLKSLNGRIDIVLDGGPCSGGIESTVVDVTGLHPRVLRPGLITVPMLEEVCGPIEVAHRAESIARSPGQMAKHYSPRTEVSLCDGWYDLEDAIEWTIILTKRRVGVVEYGQVPSADTTNDWLVWRSLPVEPSAYAARLYDTLHELDQLDLARILIEMPPDTPEWAAVRDRLSCAAAK